MRFHRSFCLATVFIASSIAFSKLADLPDGYTLQYEQSFGSKSAFDAFMMTDRSAWRLQKEKGNQVLALVGASEYEPPYRSPYNIALIKGITLSLIHI